jgi:hypothetical protein
LFVFEGKYKNLELGIRNQELWGSRGIGELGIRVGGNILACRVKYFI